MKMRTVKIHPSIRRFLDNYKYQAKKDLFYARKAVNSIKSGFNGVAEMQWYDDEKIYAPIELDPDTYPDLYYAVVVFNNDSKMPFPLFVDRESEQEHPFQKYVLNKYKKLFKEPWNTCAEYQSYYSKESIEEREEQKAKLAQEKKPLLINLLTGLKNILIENEKKEFIMLKSDIRQQIVDMINSIPGDRSWEEYREEQQKTVYYKGFYSGVSFFTPKNTMESTIISAFP